MALSKAQRIRVYEVLGISYGPGGGAKADSATIHNHYGIELTLTDMDTLRDELDAYLATLDYDVEVEILALLDEWDDWRLRTVRMETGGVDGVQGVSIDPEKQRGQIRLLMQGYVPAMSIMQGIKRRHDSACGVSFLR